MQKGKCVKGTRWEISNFFKVRYIANLYFELESVRIKDFGSVHKIFWFFFRFNCAHGAPIKLILIKKYLKVFHRDIEKRRAMSCKYTSTWYVVWLYFNHYFHEKLVNFRPRVTKFYLVKWLFESALGILGYLQLYLQRA